MKLLDTFFNIKPKWWHSLKCASPVIFPFKWIRWVSFLYIGYETSSKKPRSPEVQKWLNKCCCIHVSMLSGVTFVFVPSWPKLVNSLRNILHFTLITGQKVDQTSFIAIKSVICYASLSSHSTGKSWCFINIYTDLKAFSTTLIGSCGSFGRSKFSCY